MDARLADAEAALKEGRRDDAVAAFLALVKQDPAQAEPTYLTLARQLYLSGRMAEGEQWAARGLERHPGSADLWNIEGVFLRKLGRLPESLTALEKALALRPELASARVNRANVLMELGDADAATDAFSQLVAAEPSNPLYLHSLGGALARLGRSEEAAARLRQALALKPDAVDVRTDLAVCLTEAGRAPEAEAILDQGLAAAPQAAELMKAKASILRDSGQPDRAEAYLMTLADRFPDSGWVFFHLGDLVWETQRDLGEDLFRRAVELEPANLDPLIGLAQALERKHGRSEGEQLEEAYALALRALDLGVSAPAHTKVVRDVLERVCAYDALERLGSFEALGRSWAEAGLHTALLKQIGRVRNAQDRLELVEQHRLWGVGAERRAARAPVAVRPHGPRDKIRLGVVSSDLRRHVVSFFAQPIFDHIDHERFEVYAYSFSRSREDEVQAHIASQVKAFRWRPQLSSRDAAQMIADDQLDFLIEIGGSTNMNRLEVMAYKPAPLQASWLGYPHSTGLSTIDYLICDPYNLPTTPGLLLEKPLQLPRSWVTLGPLITDEHLVSEEHLIAAASAQDRKGVVTFGTANHPQKYSRAVLAAWGRVLARTPGSRFAFIRPEGGSPTFRANVLAAFAAEGVDEDRIVFHPVRGDHMALYNEVDITLDTFPLTGGTTTVEALWMGAPVVTLVGEAFYERQSYSILSNIGLGDLCATDVDQYVEIAVALAGDAARRRDLRAGLRDRLRDSPLGRPEAFARDFYDAIAAVVRAGG